MKLQSLVRKILIHKHPLASRNAVALQCHQVFVMNTTEFFDFGEEFSVALPAPCRQSLDGEFFAVECAFENLAKATFAEKIGVGESCGCQCQFFVGEVDLREVEDEGWGRGR